MTDALPIPSDRALVAATRDGSDAAWRELRSRHARAVGSIAAGSGRDAARRTESAFEAFHAALLTEDGSGIDGSGPEVRALRPRAIAALTGGVYGPGDHLVDPSTAADDDVNRELPAVAEAFARLPELWQSVLWHRLAERGPAATLASEVGRSASAVAALQITAERGLFDAYCTVVAETAPLPLAACRPVVAQLGGYRRGTLPVAQITAVESHVFGAARGQGTPAGDLGAVGPVAGCVHCRRRLAVGEELASVLPAAIVPSITCQGVEQYRAGIGALTTVGVSALAARRSERASRNARAAGVAAVVFALFAAAFFIRGPFGDLDPQLADLIESAGSTTTIASDPSPTTTLVGGDQRLPSRIELVFPGTPQGAVYVPGGRPLDLSVALSTPGPLFAGGTGTIDADITNNDEVVASVRFLVRASPGVVFEEMPEGDGTCRAEDDDGATCAVVIGPGETASMSLRFGLGADVPHRLVVVPSVSEALDVPVEFVPDLIVGAVGRIDSHLIGATLGSCEVSEECPSGVRDESSAQLELAEDEVVESAVLVWEGQDANEDWALEVGLVGPGGATAGTIAASDTGPAATTGQAPFRSRADVTDEVAAGGAGRYTVVRSQGARGRGSWMLSVVTSRPNAPRRLVIVTAPTVGLTPDVPMAIDLPISGSSTAPPTPTPTTTSTPVSTRSVGVDVQAWTAASSSAQSLTVDDVPVGGDDPLGVGDAGNGGGDVNSYDLEIASTEDALSIVVSTSAGAVRVTAIGVALDLDS